MLANIPHQSHRDQRGAFSCQYHIRLGVGEELREEITDYFRVLQIVFIRALFVLKENRLLRILKDRIDKWVAGGNFPGNLFVQIALWPFRLPEASFQIKTIAQHPIRTDTALDGLFWDEHPFHLVSRFSQEVEKRRSDGEFIFHVPLHFPSSLEMKYPDSH